MGNIDIIPTSMQNCPIFERISSDAMSEVIVWKVVLRVNDRRQKLLKLFDVLSFFVLSLFFVCFFYQALSRDDNQSNRRVSLFKIVSPAFRNFRCVLEQCFIRTTKTEFRKIVSTQYKYNLFLVSNSIRRGERGHKQMENSLMTVSASSTNDSRGISKHNQ